MSTPAQNPRPSARTTTTRTAGWRRGEHGVGKGEPPRDVERVDRWHVDYDLGGAR